MKEVLVIFWGGRDDIRTENANQRHKMLIFFRALISI